MRKNPNNPIDRFNDDLNDWLGRFLTAFVPMMLLVLLATVVFVALILIVIFFPSILLLLLPAFLVYAIYVWMGIEKEKNRRRDVAFRSRRHF